MKKYIKEVLLVSLSLMMFTVITGCSNTSQDKEVDTSYTAQDLYTSEYFKNMKIDVDTVNNITDVTTIDEQEYFVYFYKDECSYCEAVAPEVMKYIETKEEAAPEIHFFDMGDKYSQEYWDKSGEEFNPTPTIEKLAIYGTPEMIHFKEGNIAKVYIGGPDIKKFLESIKEVLK